MASNTFLSPWHLCLYGIGTTQANDRPLNSTVEVFKQSVLELKRRFGFIRNLRGDAINLRTFEDLVKSNCGELHDVVRYLCFVAGTSAKEEVSMLEKLVVFDDLSLETILSSDDRAKYELLMAFSKVHRLPQLYPVTKSMFFPLIAVYDRVLKSISDPFLYTRAAGVICDSINTAARSREEKESIVEVLLVNIERLRKDENKLRLRKPDGVHSYYDFKIFSWSILGRSLLLVCDELGVVDKTTCKDIETAVDQAFLNLEIDNKASQFTFLRLIHELLPERGNYDTGRFLEYIVNSYLEYGKHDSPYAYIRSVYLLFEVIGAVVDVGRQGKERLLEIILQRLSLIGNEGCAADGSNQKYDNNILCFCYAYLLAGSAQNVKLNGAMEAVSKEIVTALPVTSNGDLFKIVNCYSGVSEKTKIGICIR